MLKKFHFIKDKKVTLIVVGVVLLIGILSFLIRGLNIDIDFTGGYELTVDIGEPANDDIAKEVEALIKEEETLGEKYVASVTYSDTSIKITSKNDLDADQQNLLIELLCAKYPNTNSEPNLSNISATIGTKMMKSTFFAIALAVLLMLIYIAIRFEIASGLAAVVCLLHDLFVMLTFYSLLQIPISSSVIAAFLTILGYSINATIVVFDRIRENRKKADKSSFAEVVNQSAHETMGRSVNTTITTLLTIGAIFVACAISVVVSPTSNLDALRDFSGTLIIGIIAGLFSSVFLSGMLWNALSGIRFGKKKKN